MRNSVYLLLLGACLMFGVVRVSAQQYDPGKKIDLAVCQMDDGQYEASGKLLRDVLAHDRANERAKYELARLSFLQGDFKSAVKTFKKMTDSPEFGARAYRMLGNAYDSSGDSKKAIEAYEKGVERYPRSGALYLELGNLAFKRNDYLAALLFFERGIAAEPMFASNYYAAATVFLTSDQPIWGLFYGELFMNLERGSQRTLQMSKYLYDAYGNNIHLENKSDGRDLKMTFYEVTLDDVNAALPYAALCEVLMASAFPENAKTVDLLSLDLMRTGFLAKYSSLEEQTGDSAVMIFNTDMSNALLDYQRRVAQAGHLEAYNHWILMSGDEAQFDQWLATHEGQWNAFLEWFRSNPLRLNEQHYFHRDQYI